MWVRAYVSITGNEVADGVVWVAGGLPYCIRYGLPSSDLFDLIGRFKGVGGATIAIHIV